MLIYCKKFLITSNNSAYLCHKFTAMLKMIFMLAVIYIAYRLFTYQPGIPGRKPQDHIRKPYQNEPEKQGKATNSTDDDYIDYEELK
jgi:hypothetical protein